MPGATSYDLACDIWSLGVIMYILCSGTPPFDISSKSYNEDTFSDGMKDRIIYGQYAFYDACWTNVSDEAKDLIRKMLETNPINRVTIEDIINDKWMKVCLLTKKYFKTFNRFNCKFYLQELFKRSIQNFTINYNA